MLDLHQFESLSGVEFTQYVSKMANRAEIDETFLDYFRGRHLAFDTSHLELALYWLGKLGTIEAHHEIANYLTHPERCIRFIAIGLTAKMKLAIDHEIMSKAVRGLSELDDEADKNALAAVLTKDTTEDARALADGYRNRSRR